MSFFDNFFGKFSTTPFGKFKWKIFDLGLTICYVIEVESNVGTHYYDTINSYKLWKENPYTKFFTSYSEAQDFLNLKSTQSRIKSSITSGGYRCRFESARVVPRVGKIVKDYEQDYQQTSYGQDVFVKSPEFDEEVLKYYCYL